MIRELERLDIQVDEQTAVRMTGTPIANWLTVERALYLVFLLTALFVRFFALTLPPLNLLEASNVWPAWLAAAGQHVVDTPAPTSPLFHSVSTLVFWLAGGSDGSARAVAALVGVGVVCIPYFLRPWIGRGAALVATLLFAVDPWLTVYSRLADGAVFSICFGLFTLTGLLYLYGMPDGAPQLLTWRRLTAISLGLLVVSGPLSWSFVVVLALFLLQNDPQLQIGRARGLWQRETLLLAAVAGVLGATTWLAQPANLGLISTSISRWFHQLTGTESVSYPLSWWWLRLVVDQPLLLLFGLLGLARLWIVREADTFRTEVWRPFLSVWLLWGLVLGLLPGRNPFSLVMAGLPLLFAAADLGAALAAHLRWDVNWREGWILLALLTVLLTAALLWGAALLASSEFAFDLLRVFTLFTLLAALTVVLFAVWVNWSQALWLVGGYIGCLLVLVTLSSGWQLNQRLVFNEPDGFFAETTDPDVERLVAAVKLLSAQRIGDATEVPLSVQIGGASAGRPDPVLGWYLRDFRNLNWVLAPAAANALDQRAPVFVTWNADASDPQLAGYMGSRYGVYSRWLPSSLLNGEQPPAAEPAGLSESWNQAWRQYVRRLLRWMVYREAPTQPASTDVVLWVKGEQ